MESSFPNAQLMLLRHAQRLRTAIRNILRRHVPSGEIESNAVSACIEAMESGALRIGTLPFAGDTLPDHIEEVLGPAIDGVPTIDIDISSLVASLRHLLNECRWVKRVASDGEDDDFVEKHRHAIIMGRGAIMSDHDLTIGLALMKPKTYYAFHNHPPAEFYLVLSEGDWYGEEKSWWSPGIGGVVFNPSNAVHSMRSNTGPLLALWILIGESPHMITQ